MIYIHVYTILYSVYVQLSDEASTCWAWFSRNQFKHHGTNHFNYYSFYNHFVTIFRTL